MGASNNPATMVLARPTTTAAFFLPPPPAAGRNTLRATMTAAMQEVDALAFERHATPFGEFVLLHWRVVDPGCNPAAPHRKSPLRCHAKASISHSNHPPACQYAGAAKEVAVLAALRLLRAALDRDAELVAAIRAATQSGGGLLLVLLQDASAELGGLLGRTQGLLAHCVLDVHCPNPHASLADVREAACRRGKS